MEVLLEWWQVSTQGVWVLKLAFQTVKTGAHQPKCLVQVRLSVLTRVLSAQLDTLGEKASHMERTRHDISVLVRDVIFHARFLIDGQLNTFINWASQASVVLTGVFVVRVVLGVVNVVLRAS